MKKILIAFDGLNFSEAAFNFAKKFNQLAPSQVTGVFVPQIDYANLWSYSNAAGVPGVYIPLLEQDEIEAVATNIKHFEDQCEKDQISYRVHKDFYDFALTELKRESRFADVMIVSGELFYKHFIESGHLDYLEDMLHNSECPVLVVPEHYDFPDNNILAYDGSEESVFAIKQFAYIFPELAKNHTLLVYADKNERKGVPSIDYITELANQHYKNLTVYKLDADPKKYFNSWVGEVKKPILVSGSFRRSTISNLLHKSFVHDIIKDHKLPVFVAHK